METVKKIISLITDLLVLGILAGIAYIIYNAIRFDLVGEFIKAIQW